MFSRGKLLVNLSLKTQSNCSSSNDESKSDRRSFTIQGENIEERPSTSTEQDRSNEFGEQSSDMIDREKQALPIVDNINSELSDRGVHSDISIDYDDDVRDPDWKAPAPQSSDSDDMNKTEVDHEEVIAITATENKGSKRKQETKEHFMKAVQKKKRMKGEQYLGVLKNKDSGVKSYCVERAGKLLCPRQCSNKCHINSNTRACPKVHDDDRSMIFERFWKNMDWKEKKLYVINHVQKCQVTERTTVTPHDSRRNFSYKYHLTKGTDRVPVCKSMFTTTLGIGEKMIYNWLHDCESGIPNSEKTDTRGSNEEFQRRKQSARDYLTMIPKVESHYCRSSSKKQYLESLFESKNHVYKEYEKMMNTEGKTPYNKTGFFEMFEQMNLSLWQPKKDQCDKCCEHQAGNLADEEHQYHLKKKDEARDSKTSDKTRAKTDASVKVLCMDLESLLVCPRSKASSLYYKMKLSCHNFTIYDLVSDKAKNYFWHEGEGELNANIFATCVIDYLDNIDLTNVTEIIIYSDGCTYQNRNTTMANALLLWAARKNVTVFQKYLERGHTQMECDTIHSCIERKVRNKSIYVPQMYVDNILEACHKNPCKVQYVDHTFFTNFDALGYYPSIRPGTGVGSSMVTDIRVLKYLPEGKIQCKLNHGDTEFMDIPKARSQRSRTVQVNDTELVGKLYNRSLPIKKAKYLHLMQLKSIVPKDYHGFYDCLSHAT